MAIQKQVKLLLQGTDVWNKWRAQHKEASIDLSQANLIRADFSRANLSQASLDRADLSHADLSHANLGGANLGGANLGGANLSFVDLRGANLSYADLRSAFLKQANLNQAVIGWTHFADIDLSTVEGLETVKHKAPSYISTRTLERSQGNIPEAFLRDAGLSDTFIEYVRSLVACPIEYYSCFLSSSHKDQDIAERLCADLRSKRVRCWHALKDLKIGDHYHQRIDESIRLYDKLILILSEHAVQSAWVEREVASAREKEDYLGHEVLFPIRLDDAVMSTTKAWAADVRRRRHIGDFTQWKNDDSYQQAFERLLRDLKAEQQSKD